MSPASSRHATSSALLLAVCLAALAMPISFTGPAVTLPLIRASLGGSPVQAHWVTNAFMLSFGASLMAAGALADAFGRRRVFLGGLALNVCACVALAAAPGILSFEILRGLQGLACAGAFAGGTAGLAQAVSGAARTRAFSLIGTSFGAGLALGPLLSAWLGGLWGWPSVVLCPGAISLLALCIGVGCMDESRHPHAAGLDWPGALSFTVALSLLTAAVLQAPASGWTGPWVLVALGGSVGAGAVFVATERHLLREGRLPMLDLSLLRYPRFVGVQCLAAAPAYSFVVLLVLLPYRFIGLEGRDAVDAGLWMLLLSAPLLVMPTVAAVLSRRVSAGRISAGGLLLCAVGLMWLSRCPPGSTGWVLAGPLLSIGVGIGLPWGLMDGLAVSVVPRERAGMAAGIFNTVRVAGEGVALALVGAGLTALVALHLSSQRSDLHGSPVPTPWVAAAQSVTTGDMPQALALLPGLGRAAVLEAYGHAFSTLLQILAGATVVTALVILGLLRGTAHEGDATQAVPQRV